MQRPPAPSPEPNAFGVRPVFCPKDTLIQMGVSTGKVKVSMGVSEFALLVALIGLVFFGGAVKIKFKGAAHRKRDGELKDGERKLLDE